MVFVFILHQNRALNNTNSTNTVNQKLYRSTKMWIMYILGGTQIFVRGGRSHSCLYVAFVVVCAEHCSNHCLHG